MQFSEAFRRPSRRFFESTTCLPNTPSEPPEVLVAHHGVPKHPHPASDTVTNPPPYTSGISPALLLKRPIVDSTQPTGPSTSEFTCLTGTSSKTAPAEPFTLNPVSPANIQTNMLDDLFVSSSTIDWDQFLVKDADFVADAAVDNDNDSSPASAVLPLASQPASPASNTSTPKSTESEQSQSLDLRLLEFDFDLPAPSGIVHDPSDIFATPTAGGPDMTLNTNPTMSSAFGATLGDFSSLSSLGDDTASQLQLSNLLRQFSAPSTTPTASAAASADADAYSLLAWTHLPNPAPSTPALPSSALGGGVAMKRKASEAESETSTKRARATPASKRPYRRQSKNGLSLSQLAAAAASGSPIVVDQKDSVECVKEEEIDVPASVRLTSTGKPSTARPKAVVPEKYMKNGEAQAITGMTTEEILAFPNWAALMECVDEEHRGGAEIFGKMITENRDKAKWAAKKSRDERKAKVETLEGQVDELQTKLNEMRGVLLGLVGRGVVQLAEVEAFI